MVISFGQSAATLGVIRRLNQSGESLSRVFEQLSSGQRINRASDDAAGLAVAAGLNVDSRILGQAVRNLSDGTSILNIADQALGQLTSIVNRQLELAEQSSNGVFSDSQRAALELEDQALRDEYNRILESTSFNDILIFGEDLGNLNLQAGSGDDAVLSVEILENVEGQLETFTQSLNAVSGNGFSESAYGAIRFLKLAGADGKDTLLALSIVQDAGGNTTLLIQSFRAGPEGTLELVEQRSVLGTVQDSLAINATMAADLAGNTIRFNLNVTGGGGQFAIGEVIVDDDGKLSAITNSLGPMTNQLVQTIAGDFTGLGQTENVSLAPLVGDGAGGENTKTAFQATLYQPASAGLEQGNFSVATQASALLALESLRDDLESLSEVRARIGAGQSRVEVATKVLESSREQIMAAESRIMDADIAASSSELVRQTILQQSATAVLAQANIQPELALSLLTFE